jgi:hypothetical protein
MTFIGVFPGDFVEITPFFDVLLHLFVTLLFLWLGLVFERLFVRVFFVGIFYRKSVLVNDGKNNIISGKQENHKLRRRTEQYAKIKAQKGKHTIET